MSLVTMLRGADAGEARAEAAAIETRTAQAAAYRDALAREADGYRWRIDVLTAKRTTAAVDLKAASEPWAQRKAQATLDRVDEQIATYRARLAQVNA